MKIHMPSTISLFISVFTKKRYCIFCFDQIYIKYVVDNVKMQSNWGEWELSLPPIAG